MKNLKEAIYSGRTVSVPVEGDGHSGKVNNMHKILDEVFGQKDGAYFTHAETLHLRDGKKYNVVLVEDSKGNKFQIWFDFGPAK